MIPTDFILDDIWNAEAASATGLGQVMGNKVALAKAPFTPGPGLTIASFTEADFAGYARLTSGGGTQQEFIDPDDTARTIQLLEPAGGWSWETTGLLNLPQTIYGYFVMNNAGTQLFGSRLLDTPIVLMAINEGVNLTWIRIKLPAGAVR